MENRQELASGPSASRVRRRHARTLLGVATPDPQGAVQRTPAVLVAERALPSPRVADVVREVRIVEAVGAEAPRAMRGEAELNPPSTSSFRVDDAVAAGLTLRKPVRTLPIFIGLALLTAVSIAATTFIAREIDEQPTREQAQQLVKAVRVEASNLGEKVDETLGAAR